MRRLLRRLLRLRWPKEIRHLPEPETLTTAAEECDWTETGIWLLRWCRLRSLRAIETEAETPDGRNIGSTT